MKKSTMNIVISFDGVHYKDLKMADLPNLRQMSKVGKTVHRLETVFPSVTWNIHTSLITGKYPKETRVYGNAIYNKKDNKERSYFHSSIGQEVIKSKTIFEKAHRKGLKMGAVCWPLTQSLKEIQFNIPELYTQKDFEMFSTVSYFNELKKKGYPVEKYGEWSKEHILNHLQDHLTEKIMEDLIVKDVDLIFGHFLLYDSYQHEFGVGSKEAKWALEYVDMLIGKLIKVLEEMERKYNLLVFSDHGHCELQNPVDVQDISKDITIVNNGGALFLYGQEASLLDAKEKFLCKEGVYEIFQREEFPRIHFPIEDDDTLPQMIVSLKEGYYLNHGKNVKSGHGYNPKQVERMNGFGIFVGEDRKDRIKREMKITDLNQLIEDLIQVEEV